MTIAIHRRYVVLPFLLLLLAVGGCSGHDSEAETAWLIGSWTLSHNPENDDEDILVFDRGGKLQIKTVDGRTLPGQYVLEGNKLKVVLPLRKKVIETSFAVDPGKQRLTYENGAYYTKQKSVP